MIRDEKDAAVNVNVTVVRFAASRGHWCFCWGMKWHHHLWLTSRIIILFLNTDHQPWPSLFFIGHYFQTDIIDRSEQRQPPSQAGCHEQLADIPKSGGAQVVHGEANVSSAGGGALFRWNTSVNPLFLSETKDKGKREWRLIYVYICLRCILIHDVIGSFSEPTIVCGSDSALQRGKARMHSEIEGFFCLFVFMSYYDQVRKCKHEISLWCWTSHWTISWQAA